MKLCYSFLVLVLAGAAWGVLEKRIVGSKSCEKNRQYHVQIEAKQGGQTCGGSLLNARWVITASHCAERLVKVKLAVNEDKSWFSKGVSWLKTKTGLSKGNEQEIAQTHQFTFKDEEHSHDIMLIRLKEDASPKLPTVSLPLTTDCQRPEVGHFVDIGGFGSKKAGKAKIPSSLMCASTKITECGENDKPDGNYNHGDSTMCAHEPGVESCAGDAGSAVEYKGLLQGIIVSKPVDKCANTIVMLDICHYREWMDKTMKEN